MSSSFEPHPSTQSTTIEPQSAVVRTRFMLERKLGSGGMGTVWLARDTTLQRWVALKSIRPDLCGNEAFRKRMERECLLHAKVGAHAHIVTLYDKIEDAGEIHLVMEYVEGQALQQRLEECAANHTSIPWAESAAIVSQSLSALSRIHEHGIVHRDIKPANIMLTREADGSVVAKLTDFGVARAEEAHQQLTQLTSSGSVSPGTPLYMSPEQIDSRTYGEVTERSDIYAMGIVFYQCLSGHVPFGGTLTEVLNGHLNTAPPPLILPGGSHLPKELAAAANKAMAKRPEKRYATAAEFRADIEHVVSGRTTQAETLVGSAPKFRPTASSSQQRRSARPLLIGGLVGGLAGAAVIAGLVFALMGGRPGASSADTASAAETAAPVVGQQRAWSQPDTTPPDTAPNAPDTTEDVSVASVSPADSTSEMADDGTPLFADDALFEAPEEAVAMEATGDEDPSIAIGTLMVVEPGAEGMDGAAETGEGKTHVVQRGESMSKIAQNYGLDWIELSKWNEMENPSLLTVGQTLYLYKREGIREVTVRVSSPKPKAAPAEPAAPVAEPAPAPPVVPVVEAPPPAEEEKPGLLKRIFRKKKTDADE